MIQYTEKGPGLHSYISAAGHTLAQIDGAWVADDEAAVNALIASYPLTHCQAEIVAAIDAHACALRESVVAGISPAEMASWSIKQREAMAYQASAQASDAPLLSVEAQARGVLLSTLVEVVAAKGAQLAMLEAVIAGVSGKHADAVRACTTFEAALVYDWRTDWPL